MDGGRSDFGGCDISVARHNISRIRLLCRRRRGGDRSTTTRHVSAPCDAVTVEEIGPQRRGDLGRRG